MECWEESVATPEHLLSILPITNGPEMILGECCLRLGRTEAAVDLFQRAILKWPRNKYAWCFYAGLAQSFLFLGELDEAIAGAWRARAVIPEQEVEALARQELTVSGARVLSGDLAAGHEIAMQAARTWPYVTVRGYWTGGLPSARVAQQVERVLESLRAAGVRDHADEDADFGIAPPPALLGSGLGLTPRAVPGAPVIRTSELPALLTRGDALVLDASLSGRSVPGALGAAGAGGGGRLDDDVQDRLAAALRKLTRGQKDRPIVAMGWNAESLASVNFAMRILAAGYTCLHWYRGGQEAWQASGQKVENLRPFDW